MVNASSETHRQRASQKFHELFLEELQKPNSFKIPLESIPFISTVMPPDSTFKIFTFNFTEESGKTFDFGYVQTKNSKFKKLNPLEDLADVEYEKLDVTSWVSGLYYHIIPFKRNNKNYYVLFGYSQPNFYEKRKVIDVLHFENDEPVFGEEVFIEKKSETRPIIKTRRVFYYASDAYMNIRDDKDMNAIVIDHLMEVKSRIEGFRGNSFVPDGTYTAYIFKDGVWNYNNMLWGANEVNEFTKPEDLEKEKSKLFKN